MRRRLTVLGALLTTVALLGTIFVATASARAPKILVFDTMIGVRPALTGTKAPIRGINGGGLPWVVRSARGQLFTDGQLEVDVQGLVLDPTDPGVIAAGLAGMNPIPSLRAIVSCVTGDAGTSNVMTAAFPATTGAASAGGGDVEIEAQVTLPGPCIAPIVFVASPGGAWFAATGH